MGLQDLGKVLIANRGEIACRVIRTARRLGLRSVAVYSEPDAASQHVALADEAVCVGPAPSGQSYLKIDAILDAARRTGAQAVHPGYGFLSENAQFADAVVGAGLTFIGPPASAMRAMGSKDAAKRLMEAAGVPLLPGYHGEDQSAERLRDESAACGLAEGLPVLLKAVLGGGGKGMRIVRSMDELQEGIDGAMREAVSSFGDGRLIVERYLPRARHIEVQVFADTHGGAVHLFERDCSVQVTQFWRNSAAILPQFWRNSAHFSLTRPTLLVGAAAPSKSDRGGAGAGRRRRAARGARGGGGARGTCSRLRRRGDGGVHRRRRRPLPLLLHGDEHAAAGRAQFCAILAQFSAIILSPHLPPRPAGRAPGDRDGDGRRPRRVAAPRRRRRGAPSRAARALAGGPRLRGKRAIPAQFGRTF